MKYKGAAMQEANRVRLLMRCPEAWTVEVWENWQGDGWNWKLAANYIGLSPATAARFYCRVHAWVDTGPGTYSDDPNEAADAAVEQAEQFARRVLSAVDDVKAVIGEKNSSCASDYSK